ncbi:hypothetical protein OROHE_013704 [Orobanche hederae]
MPTLPVMRGSLPESQFSLAIVRVAVAQICQSTGFKGAQNSALEALAEVAARYLQEIAKLAAASANSDGRTESNLPDIIVALEDLSSIQGYLGLSNVRSPSLYTSSVVRDLMNFVKYTYEIPFARPLPPRKVYYSNGKKFLKRGNSSSGSRGYCDGGRWGHVPRWLPAVPVEKGKEKVVETEKEVIWGSLENVKSEEEKKLKYRHHHQESEIRGNREKTGMVGNLRGTGTEKCSLVIAFNFTT